MQRTETYPLGRRLILKLYFTCLRRKHSLAKDTGKASLLGTTCTCHGLMRLWPSELDQAEHALWELSTLNDAARIIHEQSDTRFLYWFQDLLPPILQFLRSDNIQVRLCVAAAVLHLSVSNQRFPSWRPSGNAPSLCHHCLL